MPRTRHRKPKTKHFKLAIAYDGTRYGGWQLQPNVVTIQGLIEAALKKIAGHRVVVHGSGRTDAGVHAREQIANCSFATRHTSAVLLTALNANLPEDVCVLRVQEVEEKFHARFSAKAKEYRYQIDICEVADPFLRAYSWHHPRSLNVATMRKAAALLKGRHDFSALSAKPSPRDAEGRGRQSERDPMRTISTLTVTKHGNLLTICVRADGFLYKMVRSIVGALVKVGDGKLTVEQLCELLAGKKRTALIETAPAKGLFLWKVFY
jgi:tRNA pseudouridine38-40 synthase